MLDTSLETTYELHVRSRTGTWTRWLADLPLETARGEQQAWNNINKEARVVEVTRRVL